MHFFYSNNSIPTPFIIIIIIYLFIYFNNEHLLNLFLFQAINVIFFLIVYQNTVYFLS